MRPLVFSAFGLALALGAFCSPLARLTGGAALLTSAPALSLPDPVRPVCGPLAVIQRQAQDQAAQVSDILDQIGGPATAHG